VVLRARLERAGQNFVQTLEPRAFYVYVPYRTRARRRCSTRRSTTSTFGQFFSVNRYLGNDRIGDANQLTLALTSRLLDPTRAASGCASPSASVSTIRISRWC
jgi:LPS-assembly protein